MRGHVLGIAFIVRDAEHLPAGSAHGARKFREPCRQYSAAGMAVRGLNRHRREFAVEDRFHDQVP